MRSAHLPPFVSIVALVAVAACTPSRNSGLPPEGETAYRLVDVTARAGLDGIRQISGGDTIDFIIESLGAGAAWLDYDGDSDLDLYLAQGATPAAPQSGPPDRLLRNDGDTNGDGVPEFTDVTAAAGLGDTRWSFGVAVADFDGDNDPDLLLLNWGANRLYRNEGDGTFTDVAPAAGLADERWGVSAAWSDVDRDGDLDVYVTHYVDFAFARYPARGAPGARGEPPCSWKGVEVFCGPRNLEAADDALFLNGGDTNGDGVPEFTDVTAQAGLATPPLFGLAVHFLDADDDGDDDLYVANDSVQNSYFVNRGDGTFEELAIVSGLAYNEQGHEQAGMGVAVGDYNRDERLDLAVTNFSHDHDTLYRNDGGGFFTDVSYPSGIGTPSYLRLGWGVTFADMDHDGREDLLFATGHVYPQVDGQNVGTSFRQPNALFRNVEGVRFEDAGGASGAALAVLASSRAVLPADIDGDGDLDVLFTNLGAPPQLLLNVGAQGRWLQIRLRGTGANRDAIGARVIVTTAGGVRQVREIRRDAAYAGSLPPVAHFGLGTADVERVEVRWPDGTVSVHDDVAAGRLWVLAPPTWK